MIGETLNLAAQSTFATIWTSDPPECNLEYKVTVTPATVDPNLIIIENDLQNDLIDPKIQIKSVSDQIYFGGDQFTG